ncbi:MAG: hypothetical protein Q8M16_22345 [Pirellulaceae bacterium]|nr:hypothetical protein [Pirellulaceae bacterium]
MFAFLLAQSTEQSEYGQMWGLVLLMVLLGALAVAIPRFRRIDLLTDAEKKKIAAQSNRTKGSGHK